MTAQNLTIRLVSRDGGSSSSAPTYWLRMEQIKGDDIITTAEIATLVDDFYDIDPCIPLEPETTEETAQAADNTNNKTFTDLLALAATRLDLAECDRRKSGDYTALVKIIRSHVNPPEENTYTIKPSVGTLGISSLVQEELTQTHIVTEQDSLTLDYPVLQGPEDEWPGKAQWLGSVWTKDGTIAPPKITGIENRLSWSPPCNGTILVKFPTVYDIATVNIPGIPSAIAGAAGSTQDCTLRAFYHYQVYEATVTAVNADTTADADSLAAVCGWADFDGSNSTGSTGSGGISSSSDSETDPTAEDDNEQPELGCISPNTTLASPTFYRSICCKDPSFRLPDCSVSASARSVGELSPEAKRQAKADNNSSRVEFVAVGPGPDGCGRLFTRQNVNPRACCDDVTPMQADPDNPTSISGTVELSVFYGKTDIPWEWQCSSGLKFTNGLQTLITRDRRVTVIAVNLCQNNLVRVNDTCSRVSIPLTGEVETLEIDDADDIVIAPGGDLGFSATGGTLPFVWTGNNDLTLVAVAGRSALFTASEDFCGTADVYVTDSCGQIARATVRSTDGEWQDVTLDYTDGGTDNCSPGPIPTAGGYTNFGVGQVYLEKVSGKWKVRTLVGYAGSGGGCPNGNDIGGLEYACIEMFKQVGAQGAIINGNCCLADGSSCVGTNESLSFVYEWVCSA